VLIHLDKDQQTMIVTDNAGGVSFDNLPLIVSPGQTGNSPINQTIGIFGVGSKRAVVALAQDIKITSRFNNESTYQISYDDPWLKEDTWELSVYQVDDLKAGTTKIELSKLRIKIDEESETKLFEHLGATYARFLTNKNLTIYVNNIPVKPVIFENWAYPPNSSPGNYKLEINVDGGDKVNVEITAGLITTSYSGLGEYGVYFYCNDRLISRGNKSYDVGFTTGKIGVPHASISIIRALVSINGPAQWMPWNSSKSDINPNHKIFLELRNLIIEIMKRYATISRALVGDIHENVFKYTNGNINQFQVEDTRNPKKLYLPPLQVAKPRYAARIKSANKAISKSKPRTTGLYESVAVANTVFKSGFDRKNRIALIILDSTLEIAFKEYLVNEQTSTYYDDNKIKIIFNQRHLVHEELKKCPGIAFSDDIWKLINYFHEQRNKLTHERASVDLPDSLIETFRDLVQVVLTKLFDLNFSC
jgi:Histidine kinase-, DNA gyrase B-, and HSP90-like ATPase